MQKLQIAQIRKQMQTCTINTNQKTNADMQNKCGPYKIGHIFQPLTEFISSWASCTPEWLCGDITIIRVLSCVALTSYADKKYVHYIYYILCQTLLSIRQWHWLNVFTQDLSDKLWLMAKNLVSYHTRTSHLRQAL